MIDRFLFSTGLWLTIIFVLLKIIGKVKWKPMDKKPISGARTGQQAKQPTEE